MDWREHIARKVRGEVLREVPLAPRTSVRVGGAAELWVRPADLDDLVALLRAASEVEQAVWPLGGGANTVVGDGGVPGITLKLGADPEGERVEDLGDRMRLELPASASSARLVQLSRRYGLLGAEWAAGIPGTLGGMVAMNAGTRAGEMKDCLEAVLLCGGDGAGWVPAAELRCRYRHSELGGRIAARVRMVLRKGSPEEVAASARAMETDKSYRRNTQPLQLPNSGSVFRNPPGDHAGRLIEAMGLKGERCGGALISPQHANFIVNTGGASARDVLTLVARAQRAVLESSTILLALEIRLVGFFTPSMDDLGVVIER